MNTTIKNNMNDSIHQHQQKPHKSNLKVQKASLIFLNKIKLFDKKTILPITTIQSKKQSYILIKYTFKQSV